MKIVIANWKANKNLDEIKIWSADFLNYINKDTQTKQNLENDAIKIIICPPFPLIYPLMEMLGKQKNIEVGSQDVSVKENGTFTGEVTADNLRSLVAYTILGHSERKKYFAESDDLVKQKYVLAKHNGIQAIYCIADSSASFPSDVTFLCLEPPSAISTGDGRGNNESLEYIITEKSKLKIPAGVKFIYGGSVNKDNIAKYIQSDQIDGVLIGGASLDPLHFYEIISRVSD